MNNSAAAQLLMPDNSVTPDIGISVTQGSTAAREAGQSVQDFRTALLTMIPQLRAFTRMLSGDKNSAEKLSLTTLTEAWRCRFAIGPETNLKVWLFAIARRNFRSIPIQLSPEAPLEHTPTEGEPGHGGDGFWAGDISDSMRALQILPNQFREALILVSASSCSYEEAAKICDCPVGTVKSRVFRARQALAANLDTMSAAL